MKPICRSKRCSHCVISTHQTLQRNRRVVDPLPGSFEAAVMGRESARTGDLHTRLYREEKEHVATVAIDLGTGMFTGSDRLRAVSAALIAGQRLWQLAAQGCRCGIVIALPGEIRVSSAANGERGALAACASLHTAFADARQLARQADTYTECLPALLDWLARGSRRLGRVILVTGFDGVADDSDDEVMFTVLRTQLASIRSARELDIVLIEDPVEVDALPEGTYRFRDTTGARRTAILDRRTIAWTIARLQTRRDALQNCCREARIGLQFGKTADRASRTRP